MRRARMAGCWWRRRCGGPGTPGFRLLGDGSELHVEDAREALEVRTCSERVNDGHIDVLLSLHTVQCLQASTAYPVLSANYVVYSLFDCVGLKYKTNKYPPSRNMESPLNIVLLSLVRFRTNTAFAPAIVSQSIGDNPKSCWGLTELLM